MLRYVLRRLVLVIPTLIGILTLVFGYILGPRIGNLGRELQDVFIDQLLEDVNTLHLEPAKLRGPPKPPLEFIDFVSLKEIEFPVLDDRHLVIPDRLGNKRFDGMRNLLENPHVGLIFLVPGREETLRVNGRAVIVRDEDLLAPLAVKGKRPPLGIGVEVEECYLHCAKAFKRSALWEPECWPDASALPSMACALWNRMNEVKPVGMTVEEYERDMQERLKQLY